MDEAEHIIAAVKERDILWNRTNRSYKNVKAKAKEWRALSMELNLPVDIVKKRWRGLRDNYARNLSKNKFSAQGTDDVEPVGKYSAQMEFLRHHYLKPKITNEQLIESAEDRSQRDLDYSAFGMMFVDVGNTAPTTSSGTFTSLPNPIPPSLPNSSKRRRVMPRASVIERMCLSTMTSSQTFISNSRLAPATSQSHLPAPSNMEDEFFCRSLVEKLSSFPIELRNSTKLEILRYINDVQLEWLRQQQS